MVSIDSDYFCSDIRRRNIRDTIKKKHSHHTQSRVSAGVQSRVSAGVQSHMASSTIERSCLVQLLNSNDSEQSPQDKQSPHCVAESTTDFVHKVYRENLHDGAVSATNTVDLIKI